MFFRAQRVLLGMALWLGWGLSLASTADMAKGLSKDALGGLLVVLAVLHPTFLEFRLSSE